MIIPAADSFCKCVTFGILGTFQRINNARALLEGAGWLAGGWMQFVAGFWFCFVFF